MKKEKMNPKMEKEIESLPDELKPIFKRIVDEYQYHCVLRYGRAFVSYAVLADLVRDGWKPIHDKFVDSKSGSIMSQFSLK
ncbi:hypothetical protein ACFL2S_12070 [Thermodesulfobacteriota bacterium]